MEREGRGNSVTNITEYGYSKLRDFIKANWNFVELQDTAGAQIIRLGIGDSRVTWLEHNEGADKIKIQIVVKGADITLPATFGKLAIFDTNTGGEVIAITDVDVTIMKQVIDEFTAVATFTVPTVNATNDVIEEPEDDGRLW